jgi:hypothetical protein
MFGLTKLAAGFGLITAALQSGVVSVDLEKLEKLLVTASAAAQTAPTQKTTKSSAKSKDRSFKENLEQVNKELGSFSEKSMKKVLKEMNALLS